MMTSVMLGAMLNGAVVAAVPLLLAGLGEQMSQRAGVLNIGLEGMMVAGAYAGFAATLATGSPALGLLAGAAAGAAVAAVMAVLCVARSCDQVVVGVGLTLGLEGLTALLFRLEYARSHPRLAAPAELPLPGLAELPVIGPGLFTHHPAVYLAVALAGALFMGYRHLHLGLMLAAAGDRPEALDVAGGRVALTRAAAVMVAGTLAGAGGGFLAIVGAGTFVPFITGGAGFMAIALVMLAGGHPLLLLGLAVGFGACLALTTALQLLGLAVPTDAVQMVPYAMVLLVLAVRGRRTALPVALGVAFRRAG